MKPAAEEKTDAPGAEPDEYETGKNSKKIGMRKTSDGTTGVGEITTIDEGRNDDQGMARITVRYGKRPPPPNGDKIGPSPWPTTCDVIVPAAVAKGLKLHQKVRISITPV